MTQPLTSRRPAPPLFAVLSPSEEAPATSHSLNEAYEAAMPAAQALRPDPLVLVNVDVPAAVSIALGCVPRIRKLRDQVAKELPYFEIAQFDLLETFALATAHAHVRCLALTWPPADLGGLRKQCAALRSRLHAYAGALAQLGLLSKAKLKSFKKKNGDQDLVHDLQSLAQLLRANWHAARPRSAVQSKQLSEAEVLATRLWTACGAREQALADATAILRQRQRNFTLLVQAHRQVRRAIAYLCVEEDDVDQIVPSLYRARRSDRRESPSPPVKSD